MRFRAKVLTTALSVELISLEAGSSDEARHVVETSGGRLLDLQPIRSIFNVSSGIQVFNLRVFNQQLHTLLDAGQPIVDAIAVLGRNDRKDRHRAIYNSLLTSLQQGKQLSEAMTSLPSVFPRLYVALVKASETTGTVRASIRRFMQYQQQADETRNKLVAAGIYPAILVGVGFVVISFLLLYIVPRFSQVFEDVVTSKHATVGIVQVWGSFVRNNTVLAWTSLLMGVVVTLTFALHPRARGFLFRKLLDTPWIGEKVWILQLARMYRTLGMLLHSGVSVLIAMKMTETALPVAMGTRLRTATQAVSEGKPMSVSMSECGLSTEVSERLLLAGESSGNLDVMMERIADFFDQETASWIDTAGRLIEPILMVGIGIIIGGIVLMLYSTIFDLASAI